MFNIEQEVYYNSYIVTPRINSILEDMVACKNSYEKGLEPTSMLIMAGSGYGKTSLINYFHSKYPNKTEATDEGETDTKPVLVVTLRSNSTKKDAATEMLKSLGDPNPTKGNLLQLTDRILTLLHLCKVQLIIIDEFSHIVQSTSQRVLGKTADWIKDIIKPPLNNPQNCPKIPMIAFGMYNSNKILKANEQLDTLVSKKHYLFPFGISHKEEQTFYIKFLSKLDAKISELGLISNLNDPDIFFRLFSASNGIPRLLMKQIAFAAGSKKNKNNEITMASYYDAYEKVFGKQKDNPFDKNIKLDSLQYIESTTYTTWNQSSKNNDVFGKKDTRLSIAESLRIGKENLLF